MRRQLHSVDRLFLDLGADNSTMGVTPLYFYDPSTMPGGEFSYPDLLAHLDHCVRSIPVLCGKLDRVTLDLDNPYLVEDPFFDIENHVRHHLLDDPTDVRQLSSAIVQFHNRPVDTSRPLWEAMVISGVNIKSLPKDAFILAIKIHHAVADGMSIMEMTAKLHGLVPIGEPAKLSAAFDSSVGGLLARATSLFTNNVMQSMQLVAPLVKVGPQLSLKLLNQGFERLSQNVTPAPRNRFSGDVSGKMVWGYAVLPISEFKKIRMLVPSATINDVVLAVVAGGLREYLKDKNELPESPMRMIAPVNVRTENEGAQAGNEISLMSVALPVHIEDPIKRLIETSGAALQAKEENAKLGDRNLSEIGKHLPPAWLSYLSSTLGTTAASKSLIDKLGSVVVSNVQGPDRELQLLGARLVNISAAGPIMDGLGLVHAVCSYNGNLNIAVNSCPQMIPDIKFYIDCLYNSFNRLLQSVDSRCERIMGISDAEPPQLKDDTQKALNTSGKATKVRAPARQRKEGEGKAATRAVKTAAPSIAKATKAKAIKSKGTKAQATKATATKAQATKSKTTKATVTKQVLDPIDDKIAD